MKEILRLQLSYQWHLYGEKTMNRLGKIFLIYKQLRQLEKMRKKYCEEGMVSYKRHEV